VSTWYEGGGGAAHPDPQHLRLGDSTWALRHLQRARVPHCERAVGQPERNVAGPPALQERARAASPHVRDGPCHVIAFAEERESLRRPL